MAHFSREKAFFAVKGSWGGVLVFLAQTFVMGFFSAKFCLIRFRRLHYPPRITE